MTATSPAAAARLVAAAAIVIASLTACSFTWSVQLFNNSGLRVHLIPYAGGDGEGGARAIRVKAGGSKVIYFQGEGVLVLYLAGCRLTYPRVDFEAVRVALGISAQDIRGPMDLRINVQIEPDLRIHLIAQEPDEIADISKLALRQPPGFPLSPEQRECEGVE